MTIELVAMWHAGRTERIKRLEAPSSRSRALASSSGIASSGHQIGIGSLEFEGKHSMQQITRANYFVRPEEVIETEVEGNKVEEFASLHTRHGQPATAWVLRPVHECALASVSAGSYLSEWRNL